MRLGVAEELLRDSLSGNSKYITNIQVQFNLNLLYVMISACISYLVFPLLSAHSLVMRRCTFILDAMQVQHLNLQLKV